MRQAGFPADTAASWFAALPRGGQDLGHEWEFIDCRTMIGLKTRLLGGQLTACPNPPLNRDS